MMPRWVIFTILTMVLWGGWGVLSKPAANALSGWQVQALSTLGLLPVIAVLTFSKNIRAGAAPRRGFWLAFGAGVIGSLGNVAYFQTLAAGGKAAAVTPLTALYPVVTIGLAVVILRERLNRVQAAGAILSLAAVYCFNVGAESAVLTPWLGLALIPIALWGLSALFQKLATTQGSPQLVTAAFLIGELPVALATPAFVSIDWGLPAGTWALLLALGLFLGVGNLTLIFAYGTGGKASVVTPLASLYSLVTIPLAVLLLDERLSMREGAGIALALIAVVGLCWEGRAPAPVPVSADRTGAL